MIKTHMALCWQDNWEESEEFATQVKILSNEVPNDADFAERYAKDIWYAMEQPSGITVNVKRPDIDNNGVSAYKVDVSYTPKFLARRIKYQVTPPEKLISAEKFNVAVDNLRKRKLENL